MRFMTAATVRNLPNYLQEDRQQLLMKRAEDEKTKAETEKKLLVNFGVEIQDVADNAKTQEDLNAGLSAIKKKYQTMGMTPDMMTMGASLARQFKQDLMTNQDRQIRVDDRNMLLGEKNLAKSDANLLGQIASGKFKSYGSEGYEVPGSEDAARAGLTGEGQLRLLDIMDKKDDRAFKDKERTWKEEDRPLQQELTRAQIAKASRDDDSNQVIQDNEGNVSLINKRTGKVINTDVKGKTTRDPDADPKPNSFKYKAERNKYVNDAVKDLIGEDQNTARQKAATEFDAGMQNWEKVKHPKTGEIGYRLKDGTIIDTMGNVVAKPRVK